MAPWVDIVVVVVVVFVVLTLGDRSSAINPHLLNRNHNFFHNDAGEMIEIPGETFVKISNVASASLRNITEELIENFDVEVVKTFGFGSLRFLYIISNHPIGAKEMWNLNGVEYVSANSRVSAHDNITCRNHPHPYTWGLDRIDQRSQLSGLVFDVNASFVFDEDDVGFGVSVYVLDTGVDVTHPEFEGRARWGYTALDMDGDRDLNGHGTHVAGTVSSKSYGVAKGCEVIAVKVLDATGQGTDASVFDGLEWVYNDHISKRNKNGKVPKSVVNLSLGGYGVNPLYSQIFEEFMAAKITVVTSAGNEDDDACFYSPAYVSDVITVAASDDEDSTVYTSFTNWGSCVDLFAPGASILSTYPPSIHPESLDYDVKSGTSMAAPHVSGVIARYIGSLEDTPHPHDVANYIIESATDHALFLSENNRKSPNKLLYSQCNFRTNVGTNASRYNQFIHVLLLFFFYIV